MARRRRVALPSRRPTGLETKRAALRHTHVTQGTLYLVLFLLLALAGLAGLFYFGWVRRKEKPPAHVKPLPKEDDWN